MRNGPIFPRTLVSGVLSLFLGLTALASEIISKPPLLLKKGDQLAMVGDSITEQKMYSRIMETYLTVCMPELEIHARQFGWSGETAEGFRHRMSNDCLCFKPTIVTTSFGMNDYKYRPYDEVNAAWYRSNYTAVVRSFKDTGARVLIGSPTCVGKVASWVKSASGTVDQHNEHLHRLSVIAGEIAKAEQIAFADQFSLMFWLKEEATKKYGTNYAIAGQDGVHPGWAGHLLMAHVYLKAMGLDGDLGSLTVNLDTHEAHTTGPHKVIGYSEEEGAWSFFSSKYPYCATGKSNDDNSIRSGMTLVSFNEDLNRFMLFVKGATAKRYTVTWGTVSKSYDASQLAGGINLAAEFEVNPFSESFARVDKAVGDKQAYETHQIKIMLHSPEAQKDHDGVMKRSEAERARFERAIQDAFHPVTYTLRISPE